PACWSRSPTRSAPASSRPPAAAASSATSSAASTSGSPPPPKRSCSPPPAGSSNSPETAGGNADGGRGRTHRRLPRRGRAHPAPAAGQQQRHLELLLQRGLLLSEDRPAGPALRRRGPEGPGPGALPAGPDSARLVESDTGGRRAGERGARSGARRGGRGADGGGHAHRGAGAGGPGGPGGGR